MDETGVPGENHRPVASHYQTLSPPLIEIRTHCKKRNVYRSIIPSNVYSLLLYLQLYKHGFRLFDGIDSSPGMLSVAEKKKKYRNLYCQFFTAEPTSIKEGE